MSKMAEGQPPGVVGNAANVVRSSTVLPELQEVYGSSSVHSEYRIKDEKLKKYSYKEGLSKFAFLKRNLKDAFLPQGYPLSVSRDYYDYQKWDTLQAFCSAITGTLATHAVLKGAGVGDSAASAIAATVTWMLKDGAGMIGRILFAWLQGWVSNAFSHPLSCPAAPSTHLSQSTYTTYSPPQYHHIPLYHCTIHHHTTAPYTTIPLYHTPPYHCTIHHHTTVPYTTVSAYHTQIYHCTIHH
jgi:hypothetical protein